MAKKIIIISILMIFSAAATALWIYPRHARKKHELKDPAVSQSLSDFSRSPHHALTIIYGHDKVFNILVDSIFDGSSSYDSRLELLHSYLRYGKHVVLRNGIVQLVEDIDTRTDYVITYEGVVVRNEALKYNWCMKTKQFYYLKNSDAILKKYGLIMRKTGNRYIPEYLENGNLLEFFANRELIDHAVRAVNFSRKIHGDHFDPEQGKDIFDVVAFLSFDESNKTIYDSLTMLGMDITGKELLDLYGVEIRWNKEEKEYQIASRLPESGPGILGPKDVERLRNSARKHPLNIDSLEGGMEGMVYPLDIYYLKVGSILPNVPRRVTRFEAYDKTTGRRLYIMGKHNFPSSATAIPVIYYRILEKTSRVLLQKYQALAVGVEPTEKAELDSMIRHYDKLQQAYSDRYSSGWRDFLRDVCRTSINWTEAGFEAVNTETHQNITFPRDDDLIEEALRELNDYAEKVDFISHFMVENYPMFLLSILRLYDVNLQRDEASGKYIIAPGPTDPDAFFDIVAELTFVNDTSETEYLKQHLTSWLTS